MRFRLAVVCLLMLSPSLSHADALGGRQDFVGLPEVSDHELANIRGGFLNANGMLIDFSFVSRIAVDGSVQSSLSVTEADLVQATQRGTHLQDIIPPAVIQNNRDNVQIALQRVLDLNIQHAAASMASMAQLHQAALQNALAFR